MRAATGLKRSTRLLFVSATYTLPAQSDGDRRRLGEVAEPGAAQAPLREEAPVASNTCTRLFSPSSTYTSPARVDGDAGGRVEAPVAAAARAPLAQHFAARGELDDAVVARVGDVDASPRGAATATPEGWLNAPAALPALPLPPPAPHLRQQRPFGRRTTSTRLWPASAT